MIRKRIPFDGRQIPTYIESGLLIRLQEFLELYRYPAHTYWFFRKEYEKILLQMGQKGREGETYCSFSRQKLLEDFSAVPKIWDRLAEDLRVKEHGVTLIAIGDEQVLRLVRAIAGNLAVPHALVLCPVDVSSLLLGGLARDFTISWKGNEDFLKIIGNPDLILVDFEFFVPRSDEQRMEQIIELLRFYHFASPPAFKRFGERWLRENARKFSWDETGAEALIDDCLQEVLPKAGSWQPINDFGQRVVRLLEKRERKRVIGQLRAVLIACELTFLWKCSELLHFCSKSVADNMISLIERAIRPFEENGEYGTIRKTFQLASSEAFQQNILIPRGIGDVVRLGTLDAELIGRVIRELRW